MVWGKLADPESVVLIISQEEPVVKVYLFTLLLLSLHFEG